MNSDLELEAWRQEWQAEDSIPTDLRKRVERQSMLMKVGLIGDAIVTVVIGGGTTAWAVLGNESGSALVALAAWIFLAIAWTFALVNNRGLWSPSAIDGAVFIDLSVRRCRSALATVWFAGALFIAEIVFGLSWVYLHSGVGKPVWKWLLFSSVRVDIVWGCTFVFFVGLVWYRNKKTRELERLLGLRDEVIEVDGQSPEDSSGHHGW